MEKLVINKKEESKISQYQLEKDFDNYLKKIKDLVIKKSKDYSNEEDAYINFKISSQIANIRIEQTFLVFLSTKIARLKELLVNKKKPNNESIQDTLMDIAVYSLLLAIYLDRNK